MFLLWTFSCSECGLIKESRPIPKSIDRQTATEEVAAADCWLIGGVHTHAHTQPINHTNPTATLKWAHLHTPQKGIAKKCGKVPFVQIAVPLCVCVVAAAASRHWQYLFTRLPSPLLLATKILVEKTTEKTVLSHDINSNNSRLKCHIYNL